MGARIRIRFREDGREVVCELLRDRVDQEQPPWGSLLAAPLNATRKRTSREVNSTVSGGTRHVVCALVRRGGRDERLAELDLGQLVAGT